MSSSDDLSQKKENHQENSEDQTKVNTIKTALDTSCTFSALKEIGYMDKYEKLPQLKFEESSEVEFSDAVPIKRSKYNTVASDNSHYYFTTSREVIRLEKYDFHKGVQLTDFFSDNGWHVFTSHSTSEGLGFGTLCILDSITSLKYEIVSINDWNVQTPSLSSDGKYLIYYDNYTYQHKNCFIGVVKVNENQRENNNKYLVEYTSYESNDWAIEELRWIDSSTIIIKGYDEKYINGKWEKQFKYIKTSLNLLNKA